MIRTSLVLALLLAPVPLAAAPLTMHVGETWVFSIRNGQPVNARKSAAMSAPKGQVRATVSPLGGTTMTLSNATGIAYTLQAELIGADGKVSSARSCTLPADERTAFEIWPRRAVAVRIGNFKRTTGGNC